MNHLVFSLPERILALIAGSINIAVGLVFFFLPEFQLTLWPGNIPFVLARFIGAIIIGNGVGAIWLVNEREWARVRPLALVATVYGSLVAVGLLYHLLWLKASPLFWFYLLFDVPFLLVFYALFIYHDIAPRLRNSRMKYTRTS
ncbi:hypothetical protein KDA_29820 [Dictyobacter alpinus]|uniref:Uncharacterized protein n=1 Tax=Dictyobacter alpinus TaxID=2014873 RepID=A0A402B827_9CHLR|nr:hypothetical protein [Dictyobacter alpinus]GCE27498.1 hypothetical protein KDA_29820 [Dictyobacter alpinus]